MNEKKITSDKKKCHRCKSSANSDKIKSTNIVYHKNFDLSREEKQNVVKH